MGTITCSNCGLQGHRYTNCLKQLKPELALRKNKHVPVARPSTAVHTAAPRAPTPTRTPTPPPRAPTPTRTPTPPPSAAGRGGGPRSGSGSGRGGGRRTARGRGTGRASSTRLDILGQSSTGAGGRGVPRAFSAPRQYAASSSSAPPPSGGTHTGWMAFFTASRGSGRGGGNH